MAQIGKTAVDGIVAGVAQVGQSALIQSVLMAERGVRPPSHAQRDAAAAVDAEDPVGARPVDRGRANQQAAEIL